MNEAEIKNFWENNPCGDHFVGGKKSQSPEEFFDKYDEHRYRTESHIPRCLDEVGFSGQDTLEIGLGQGADSEQIVRRGGKWNGLDLTSEAVSRVSERMRIRGLEYGEIKQGSVLDIPYADESFDIVYSHGVLICVPEILRAQKEVARVLRPGGRLVVMVYAKWSLNYILSIGLLRRLGLIGLYYSRIPTSGIYKDHVQNAKKMGLWKYLKMENFIHRNTDGPFNPYIKCYTLKEALADFPDFKYVRSHKEHMHAPPIPIQGGPGASLAGWHLWIHFEKKSE